jgi:hypothetical protein
MLLQNIRICFDKKMVKISKHMDKGFQIGNLKCFRGSKNPAVVLEITCS